MSNINSSNDKVEVVYSSGEYDFQSLIEKAFKIYLKTGSYLSDKGEMS